jgi:GT2 family glycosyltransferase
LANGKVDRAGVMMDEVFTSHPLFKGRNPQEVKKPVTVTYVSGTFAIYRVKAVLEVWNGEEKLFFDFGFGYFDDNVLGIQMWNHGWKSKAYPVVACIHKQSLSFGKRSELRAYLSLRNSLLLNYMTNSRYKKLIPIYALRDALPRVRSEKGAKSMGNCISKALRDFIRMRPLLKGYKLDLYRAPVVRLGLRELIGLIGLRRKVTAEVSRKLVQGVGF